MINIQTCSIDFEKIDKYKYLFRGNLNDNKDVTFQLPEQYSEALKFAKEQLEHPYWSQKPEKQTVTIGSRNVEVTVFKNGTVEFVAEGNIRKDNVTIVQRIINSLGGNTDLQIARYGVHIDNTTRFIRIGCEQENNLFSINELQKIVDTYNEMNK